MRETGDRYNLRCAGSRINIVDLLNSKTTIISEKGEVISDAIPRENVIAWIDTIIETLLNPQLKQSNYKIGSRSVPKPMASTSGGDVIIKQFGHLQWEIQTYNSIAMLIGDKLNKRGNFDKGTVIRKLNYVKSILLSAGTTLKPGRDIVRRVGDIGTVVLSCGGNHIICYEANISGAAIRDCLVNGLYRQLIYVSADTESEEVNVFDKELNLLFTCPMDASVLHFFNDNTAEL